MKIPTYILCLSYKLIGFCLFCIILNISCIKKSKKRNIEKAIIEHYSNSGDSLKKKAALFLLSRIEKNKQLTGQNYNDFIQFFDTCYLNRDAFVLGCNYFRNAYYDLYYDIDSISPEYIISNIDKAFNALEMANYRDQINFKSFCEYILPYRFRSEVLESWRDSALADIPESLFRNVDLIMACEELCEIMLNNKMDFLLRFGGNSLNMPDLPYSRLKNLPAGSCDDVAPYSIFLARAACLPVAQDFTPNYANRSSGHTWCALVLDKNSSIPFNVPNSENMGEYTLSDFIVSKVYRYTYSENTESHFFKRGFCNFLPYFLNNPNLIDVTDQYHQTNTVNVTLNNNPQKSSYAYLCVFDNQKWTVVDWGMISDGVASFKKVPQGVVFLPVIKDNFSMEPINYPFITGKNGELTYVIPDYSEKVHLNLKRKYWLSNRINSYMQRMIGGKFEASNNIDFKNAVTLFEVTENPGGIYNEIYITTKEGYRYYRYNSPEEGYGNIAELEFYTKNSTDPLRGKIIGTEGSWENNPKSTKEAAFDGNPLTFFDSPWPDDGWVGVDFGKPVKILKIRFLARNDDNNVIPGGEYELLYWDNRWKSFAKKTAVSDSLVFENVPSNALYLLHFYGEGTEERIFTYENGSQIWW